MFDHPFFLVLNIAVGGKWPGSPDASTTFPQALVVDYVRRPPGAKPHRLVATIISAQGESLEARAESPPEARGLSITFTRRSNGVSERLIWQDHASPVPLELDRCK